MIKDENASLIKGIDFCIRMARILFAIGVIVFFAGSIVGIFSIDTRKVFMTVTTFVFMALILSGTTALKLSSSLPGGEYREMTRDWSWRWKPWASIGLGFVLSLASAGYSV